MNPEIGEVIGIDVGGTSVKGARYSAAGAVLDERRVATPSDPDQLVAQPLPRNRQKNLRERVPNRWDCARASTPSFHWKIPWQTRRN